MAVTKFLARDLVPSVSIASVYTHIGGIDTITHAPSKTTSASTDFDSNGRAEHIVAERGDTYTLAGWFLEDESTGSRDPGQEALLAASHLVGAAAFISVKLTFPGAGAISFSCTVDFTGPHGGRNDITKFQAVLEVTGAITYIGLS
jgi:hypothetical protein